MPLAPGSWASLVALPIVWFVQSNWGTIALIIAVGVLVVVGWWAASTYIAANATQDPPAVVIDEIAGQCLTFLAVPIDFITLAVGFLLFRAADIFKPWPASWADRKLKGGAGAMADDLLAALYALAALHVFTRLIG